MRSRNDGGTWQIIPNRKEVTVVEILNPLTNQTGVRRKYTDFEIRLKSNSKAFTIPQSSVRRRYSDFVWLRKWLQEENEAFCSIKKTPKLPPKKIIGRFEEEFLVERMKGLQKFLRRVIEQNVFLSDKALHLFLQSSMSIKQIENYLTGKPVEVDGNCPGSRHLLHQDDDHVRRRSADKAEEPSLGSEGNGSFQNIYPSYTSPNSGLLRIPEDPESLILSFSGSLGDDSNESNSSIEFMNNTTTKSEESLKDESTCDLQNQSVDCLTTSSISDLPNDLNNSNSDVLVCSCGDNPINSMNISVNDLSNNATDDLVYVVASDYRNDLTPELPDESIDNSTNNELVNDQVNTSMIDLSNDPDNSASDTATKAAISEDSLNNIDEIPVSDNDCDEASVGSAPECDMGSMNSSFLIIENESQTGDDLNVEVARRSESINVEVARQSEGINVEMARQSEGIMLSC